MSNPSLSQLTNDKAALEQSLHNSEQRLAKLELHKDSLTREVEDLSQIKEDLTVELARTQKEKEIQVENIRGYILYIKTTQFFYKQLLYKQQAASKTSNLSNLKASKF